MDPRQKKRLENVRTHFLSSFRHIFKPKTDDITKKPLTTNLLSSYLRYKKKSLPGNLNQHLEYFLKSLTGRDKNSSLLITMRNFMDQKRIKTRNYKIIKRHFKKVNSNLNNNKDEKLFPRSLSEEKKFNKRYKYLMENISYNGNNSYASFKNLSNNTLNNIFKYKPFISYDETNIKIVYKIPRKYRNFFKNISNQSREFDFSKEDNFSHNIENLSNKKNIFFGKKISFENKMLNKLSEEKKFDDIYSEKEFNFIRPKYLEFNKNTENSNEKRNKVKTDFYYNFKNLKNKLKKQNEANENIINEIKRQQSLKQHNIQVGIVKLNEYKVKLRQIKKFHSKNY